MDLVQDFLQLVIEVFYLIVVVVRCWGICLNDCDVERACSQTDGDEPAGDWLASHNCVHNVLVKKETNTLFMFVFHTTEVKLVTFLRRYFSEVFPSYFTET